MQPGATKFDRRLMKARPLSAWVGITIHSQRHLIVAAFLVIRYALFYYEALRDGKRLVTAYWLNDCLLSRRMSVPQKALHFPFVFGKERPCSAQVCFFCLDIVKRDYNVFFVSCVKGCVLWSILAPLYLYIMWFYGALQI